MSLGSADDTWRKAARWSALGATLLLLPRLGTGGFLEPWEAAHAAVVARLAGEEAAPEFSAARGEDPYLRRPPLPHHLSAASTRVFGPSEFAARLPAALAGIALAWACAALAGRAAGARAGALAAAAVATTPLLAVLFRSALPAAVAIAASAGAFLALAAAACDATAPPRVRWAGWILLGLAAGAGGIPAVVPPAVALLAFVCTGGLFGASRLTAPRTPAEPRGRAARFLHCTGGLFGASRLTAPRTPAEPRGRAARFLHCTEGLFGLCLVSPGSGAPARLRWRSGSVVALAVASAIVAPTIAAHGSAAAWTFVRPDLAEEMPVGDEEAAAGKPDDRGGFDRGVESLLRGTYPWIVLLPAAALGLARRRVQRPGDECSDPPGADDFRLLCLLWAVGAFATTAVLGDRWHYDPFGALVPIAVVAGLYLADGERVGRRVEDAVLWLAGVGLLIVAHRDLAGGTGLMRAAAYFASGDIEAPALASTALRLTTLAATGAAAAWVIGGRHARWARPVLAAAALGWTLIVVHAVAPG